MESMERNREEPINVADVGLITDFNGKGFLWLDDPRGYQVVFNPVFNISVPFRF